MSSLIFRDPMLTLWTHFPNMKPQGHVREENSRLLVDGISFYPSLDCCWVFFFIHKDEMVYSSFENCVKIQDSVLKLSGSRLRKRPSFQSTEACAGFQVLSAGSPSTSLLWCLTYVDWAKTTLRGPWHRIKTGLLCWDWHTYGSAGWI